MALRSPQRYRGDQTSVCRQLYTIFRAISPQRWRRAVRAAPLLTAPECRSAPKALPRPKPYRAKNSTAPKALPRPKLYRAKSSTAPKALPRRKLYRAKSSIAPKALPRRNLYRAKSSIAPRALPRPTSTAPKALPHRELYRAQSSTAPKALRCPNLYRAQSSATPKALPRRKLYRVQPLIGHRRARSCTATRAVLNIVAPVIYKRRERQQEQRESSFAAALSFCCRRRPHCDKSPISPMRLKNGGSRKKKRVDSFINAIRGAHIAHNSFHSSTIATTRPRPAKDSFLQL